MKRLFALLLVATMLTGALTVNAAAPLSDEMVAYGYAKAHGMNYLPEYDEIYYGCSTIEASLEWHPELVEGVSYIEFCAISDDQSIFWDRLYIDYMTAYTEASTYFTENPKEMKKAQEILSVKYVTEQDAIEAALK